MSSPEYKNAPDIFQEIESALRINYFPLLQLPLRRTMELRIIGKRSWRDRSAAGHLPYTPLTLEEPGFIPNIP